MTIEKANNVFKTLIEHRHLGTANALINRAHAVHPLAYSSNPESYYLENVFAVLRFIVESIAAPFFPHMQANLILKQAPRNTPEWMAGIRTAELLKIEWEKLPENKRIEVMKHFAFHMKHDSGLSFINGVKNSQNHCLQNVGKLQEYAHAAAHIVSNHDNGEQNINLRYVYNATHGIIADLIECLLLHLKLTTPPSDLLLKQWNEFFTTYGHDVKFVQICHSQGALHVRNALLKAPKYIRERIIVIAVAPAAIVPKHLCHDSINITSRDFIPHLDLLAKMNGNKKQLYKIQPESGSPLVDHRVSSQTFAPKLTHEIEVKYLDNPTQRTFYSLHQDVSAGLS